MAEPTRGPFEPLVSSSTPPGSGRHAAPDAAGFGRPAEPAYDQAHWSEQGKDSHPTAEVTGEQNVDKHFDELLAQQRELISEYFKQSDDRADDAPAPLQDERERRDHPAWYADPQDYGQEDPDRGEPVIAEPPGAW